MKFHCLFTVLAVICLTSQGTDSCLQALKRKGLECLLKILKNVLLSGLESEYQSTTLAYEGPDLKGLLGTLIDGSGSLSGSLGIKTHSNTSCLESPEKQNPSDKLSEQTAVDDTKSIVSPTIDAPKAETVVVGDTLNGGGQIEASEGSSDGANTTSEGIASPMDNTLGAIDVGNNTGGA